MTQSDLVEYAKRRLSAGEAAPRVWPENEVELNAAVQAALQRLAIRVMNDDSQRAWMQQEFTLQIDPTSGRGTLTAATGAITGTMLLDGIRYGRVVDADGNQLWPLMHLTAFYNPQPTFRAYYHLDSAQIYTRAKNAQVLNPADVQPVNGPLTITASYIPAAVTSVADILADDLVDELVGIMRESGNK